MQYRVTFDRIGRNHNPPLLETEAKDADDLAYAVHRHARPHLGSRDYEVDVNLETNRVSIERGRFGSGSVEAIV